MLSAACLNQYRIVLDLRPNENTAASTLNCTCGRNGGNSQYVSSLNYDLAPYEETGLTSIWILKGKNWFENHAIRTPATPDYQSSTKTLDTAEVEADLRQMMVRSRGNLGAGQVGIPLSTLGDSDGVR